LALYSFALPSLNLNTHTNSVFNIKSEDDFNALALAVFRYQAKENKVYKTYLDTLKIDIDKIKGVTQIPFLPIEFFKTQMVVSNSPTPKNAIIFTSSGTTGSIQSKHYVHDVEVYEKSYLQSFKHFYGEITDYCLLALLPSYLERDGSSLVYMANDLIKKTNHPLSGFYLNNLQELIGVMRLLEKKGQKTILLGVTYALLDLAEIIANENNLQLKNILVMETGGMKGKRNEMIKEELHRLLCLDFGVEQIHSEYGMTELLSQAYSKGDGLFQCPPWMKVLIRDINDPFTFLTPPQSGGINIIDLANIHSCSFIATQDLGKTHPNNNFEVIGRFDNSDIRGCNLLLS
jgi:phenylacetate-coenzyme A ligase PaaK-like adenylate-forming protein